MKLWIRSQNKTQLAQITGLLLNDNEIRGFTNYHQNYYELGTYKSKERALEVLDEIQKYINNECEFLEREQHTSMGTYKNKEQMSVYEMPED